MAGLLSDADIGIDQPPPSAPALMSDAQLGLDTKPAFDSPDYVSAIAQKHGVSPDYVRNIRDSQTSTSAVEGIPVLGGLTHKAGAGISALAEPLTGVGSVAGTVGERYTKNKALEDEISSDFKQAHPGLDLAAQLIGGTAATAPLAATGLGAKALGLTAKTLPGQMGAGFASGVGINSLDAAVRGNDIAPAAGIGGLLGAAIPPVARGIGILASPFVSQIAARLNPEKYAAEQVARHITDSGQTAQGIADKVAQAAQEGQSEYTVADAMGLAGQRALSPIARAPGPARTEVADLLDSRQAGQARRLSGILSEGFDAPETAEQAAKRFETERDTTADINYGAARKSTGAVDVTPAIEKIDETLAPGVTRFVNPNSGIADDSIEALLRRARGMLTDNRSQISRFDEAFRVKDEINHMIERSPSTAQRLLIPVKQALDDQLAAASPLYDQARDKFREQSKVIEAVGLGQKAAKKGRVENTVPEYLKLNNAQREAYRAGYVDPLIEQVQGGAVGANKTRPLTSEAFQIEGQVMAPQQRGNKMMRQIARENQMFETRNAATGGSKTFDNFADAEGMAHAPTLALHAVTGNIHGLAKTSLGFMANAISGNTPAVRQEAARLLMLRGGRVTARDLNDVLTSAVEQVRARDKFKQLATGISARLGGAAIAQRASQ